MGRGRLKGVKGRIPIVFITSCCNNFVLIIKTLNLADYGIQSCRFKLNTHDTGEQITTESLKAS